jgi:hypothetical protein
VTALARAGALAAAEALRLWNLDIYDPSTRDTSPRADMSRAVIDRILRDAGWGFATPYLGNGPPQWCGLFAAACWRVAGLDPKWLATYWASTYRLGCWVRYERFDQKHPNPKPADRTDMRLGVKLYEHSQALPFEPRPGDVVIVGDGEPEAGDHITIALSYDPVTRTFDTISGNGGGDGPRGNRREGISRREYRIGGPGYCVRYVMRPAFVDLLAERP